MYSNAPSVCTPNRFWYNYFIGNLELKIISEEKIPYIKIRRYIATFYFSEDLRNTPSKKIARKHKPNRSYKQKNQENNTESRKPVVSTRFTYRPEHTRGFTLQLKTYLTSSAQTYMNSPEVHQILHMNSPIRYTKCNYT